MVVGGHHPGRGLQDQHISISDHESMSVADVRSICTEAGTAAIRKHKPRSRMEMTMQDFEEAKTMLKKRPKSR